MDKRSRAAVTIGALALGMGGLLGIADTSEATSTKTYEVTLTNLTTGQPFSPPLLATHTKRVDVFNIGRPASEGIREIAENGNAAVLATALEGRRGVEDVVVAGGPLHRIGGPGSNTMTLTIKATGRADQLSIASMLICTNDGFSGLHGVELPNGPHARTWYARAYDAGTERNTETSADIVDPCGAIGPVAIPGDGLNGRTPTSGVIHLHPGINGGADLTAAHDWENPVLKVTARRIG